MFRGFLRGNLPGTVIAIISRTIGVNRPGYGAGHEHSGASGPGGDGIRHRDRGRRPAGLAAAIRLKQVAPDRSVVVVEKGSEVGAHILSGAVIDPIGLDRLIPEWRSEETPLKTAVTADRFYALGASGRACACRSP